MTPWLDISLPLRSDTPHLPESPPFLVRRVLDIGRHDPCNVSMLWIGSHCGTHLNAPLHVDASADGVEAAPLDATIGAARVIEPRTPGPIDERELRRHGIEPGERLLVRTPCSEEPRSRRHWHVTADGARYLCGLPIRLLGVEAMSANALDDGTLRATRTLLSRGVWLLEGLDLRAVQPGRYELLCLALSIPQADAAPARAVLRPL